MSNFVVVYGKVVDDKEVGVYLDGVYFGGVAGSRPEADTIASECVCDTRGGMAIPRVIPVDDSNLTVIFDDATKRFQKLEADMIEAEEIMEANQKRRKRR